MCWHTRPVSTTWLVCVAALLLAAGCSSGGTGPHIDSVSPTQVRQGKGAQILIAGAGFAQGDVISLGSDQLPGAVWVSNSLLSVALPADLKLGQYNVEVTDPSGRRALKSNALEVGSPVPTRTPLPTATATVEPIRATPTPARTRTPSPTEQPTPIATAVALNVSGTWHLTNTIIDATGRATNKATYPNLVLQQQGSAVTGSGNGLALSGILTGNALQASYRESNGPSGTFEWTFSSDATSFGGRFTNTVPSSGTSEGQRAGGSGGAATPAARVLQIPQRPPATTPSRPGQQRRTPDRGGNR